MNGVAVGRRIAEFFRWDGTAKVPDLFPDLTPRERDVLAFLADGARNSEIAPQARHDRETARNHVSSILA